MAWSDPFPSHNRSSLRPGRRPGEAIQRRPMRKRRSGLLRPPAFAGLLAMTKLLKMALSDSPALAGEEFDGQRDGFQVITRIRYQSTSSTMIAVESGPIYSSTSA